MMNTEKDVAFMTDAPDEVQRWTAKRKAAVVMSIVKGENSAAEAALRRSPAPPGGDPLQREAVGGGDPRLDGRRLHGLAT